MRHVARVFGLLFVLPCAFVLFMELTAPGTASGISYAAGAFALSLAPLLRGAWARRVAVGACVALLAPAAARVVTVGHARSLHMHAPADEAPRLLGRLVDEEDLSVNAARAIRATRAMSDPDVAELPDAMRDAYARMRADQGSVPSPVVATYLGAQGRERYDVMEIGDVASSDGVVLFLHGFAGSFALPCWEIAQAASRARMATVCPATRWVGDWWSEAGEHVVREVVRDLRARGARRIVLAGLSNGGIGASRIAPRMRGSFSGLVVVSGAAPDAGDPGVPVLAIQGVHDAQISASVVRAYATRCGGRYVELDAGHFALLLREQRATQALGEWLRERSDVRAVAPTPRNPLAL